MYLTCITGPLLTAHRVFRAEEGEEVARMRRANPASRRITPTYRAAKEQTSLALGRVLELEELLEVDLRWTSDSPEYQATQKYSKERKYRRCVDTVERLVVQRMFELEKTNLAGTSEFCKLMLLYVF